MVKRDFGFVTQTGRQIDLDKADLSLARALTRVVPAWRACIGCGSCVASCPAGVGVRTLILELTTLKELSTLTLEMTTLQELSSLCLLCGKCQLVCPRGIPTRYLTIQIMQKTKQYAEDIPSV
jgi:ferredoxin